MIKKDNLEQFFKYNLEQFNDEPSNKVWESIETQLPPLTKKIGVLQLFIPFLMMCLLLICGFTLHSNSKLLKEKERLRSELERVNESKTASDNYFVKNACIASCIPKNDTYLFGYNPLM